MRFPRPGSLVYLGMVRFWLVIDSLVRWCARVMVDRWMKAVVEFFLFFVQRKPLARFVQKFVVTVANTAIRDCGMDNRRQASKAPKQPKRVNG